MEISKSTPYVRYRENISSTLHKGTIHIESEYLDRERKTTIESIEGQTWQNMVNGENKEEDMLPRLGLKIEGNEDVFDTVEQHMPIDTIIGDVEPVANEDGTYTYEISTMEGSYAKTLDGENNFSLTSDGLVGDMYIKYNAQGEEVNGNVVMDNQQNSYTIENSNTGEINSAFLKGQTLVNLVTQKSGSFNGTRFLRIPLSYTLKINTKYFVKFNLRESTLTNGVTCRLRVGTDGNVVGGLNSTGIITVTGDGYNYIEFYIENADDVANGLDAVVDDIMVIEYQDNMENWDIPYFEGMQSVQLPVLTASNKYTFCDFEIVPNSGDKTAIETYKDARSVTLKATDRWARIRYNVKHDNNVSYNLKFDYNATNTFVIDFNGLSTQRIVFDSGTGSFSYDFIAKSNEIIHFAFPGGGTVEITNIEFGLSELKDEPYKTNILTVNEDVTLRGVGDVKDELNLLTGEMTKRIGEVVLDGSDDWNKWGTDSFLYRGSIKVNITNNKILSDKLPVVDYGNIYNCTTYGIGSQHGHIGIRINNVTSVEDLKAFLIQNPITVQYSLTTPNITQVDLTIKDQDNKIIQSLHIYPSTTHINLSSDGLIPDAEMNYTMYGNIGETTGEQITDGTDSKLIEGKVYGDTLQNVLPSPSLKNSMDDISMQKLNNGYDTVNVVDGDVKDAILKGNTLVNQATKDYWKGQSVSLTQEDGAFKAAGSWGWFGFSIPTVIGEKYFVSIKSFDTDNSPKVLYAKENDITGNAIAEINVTNNGKYMIFTATTTTTLIGARTTINNYTHIIDAPIITKYQDGMETWNIPYFEGMQSVVMPVLTTTGKNLFDGKFPVNSGPYVIYHVEDGTYTFSITDNDASINVDEFALGHINKNGNIGSIRWIIDEGKYFKTNQTFTNRNLVIYPNTEEAFNKIKQRYHIQIEKGETATTYEPYKTNILSTPSDLELRAVGDVRDELDCLTGKMTQRIGEDGSVLPQEIVKTVDISIVDQDNQPQTVLHSFANGYINVTSQGSLPKVDYEVPTSNSYYLDDIVKPNTQYTTKSSSDCNATIDGTSYPLSANGTFTTPSTITDKLMVLDAQVDDLMFIEGDLTGRELDYFTGLQSVDMPVLTTHGKNLFDEKNIILNKYQNSNIPNNSFQISSNEYNAITGFVEVKGNTTYTISNNISYSGAFYNKDKQPIRNARIGTPTFTTPSDCAFVVLNISMDKINNNEKFQIEEGTVATPYEPYQLNILTTNEPITLHGIGDVKDELDLVNECVVRRIEKIVLDGSQDMDADGQGIFIQVDDMKKVEDYRTIITCDKLPVFYHQWDLPNVENGITGHREGENEYLGQNWLYIKVNNSIDVDEVRQILSQNPITVLYELATPTTESVRIVPQNPKQSTTSLTLQSPLQKVGNVADQLRWNPYKGHYVRYNYIQDGVANSTYTFEDLKDMNERKFVNLYNQRTYIDTDHTVQVISHGLSRYCLAEQGKQYQVRWDWIEQPSIDTIKVDLCGNVKEIPSSDNSVVIDVEKFTHQFIQIQGLGLTGKITNLMVIETVDGEIPDVDFFSGIQCVGNTVSIDGNTKVQIDMEQTNGNLIDEEFEVYSNGNGLRTKNRFVVRPNKKYAFGTTKAMSIESCNIDGVRIKSEVYDNGNTINTSMNTRTLSISASTTYSSNGSANVHYPIELCYADMAKDGIRPRYYDKESIILPMKLCRVGNIYDNLYYDDLKGYYRIQQSIGHKYFTGETTEVWTMETTDGYRTIKFICTSANIDQIALGETICNSFRHLSTINDDIEGFIIYNGNFVLRIDKDRLTDKTVDGFKTLLASNPIHLFYQLKTPQMINLTEYPNRIELNTYRDEIFTFFKGMNPTKFTLSVPMDKTYRYEIAEEGQGLANRVAVNNETISVENVVAVKEVRGQGIANIIEDVNNVVITPRPNHGAVATSHTLNNTKPATIRVHGFEASGETAVANYNVTDKAYQLKVMSSNGDNSLSDYYVLNVPYKLETYADGTKDMVYYDEAYKRWHFKGSSVKQYTATSDGTLNEVVEVFKGLAPRSGMIAEFKLMFTSGATNSRMYYSLNGTTYSYTSLRNMSDGNYLYVGIFNTGGTKIDIAYKTDPNAEYTNLSPLSTQVPECFMVNQIQFCTFCEVTINKQYIYSEMKSPIELDTYDGSTKVFMDGNATDTNIIIRNDATTKIVNTYTDTEYTVYWKYVDGLGNLRITLGGTTVEVDGKQEYATIKTQLNAPQELLYVGGYNLSIKDLMVVKGAKIDDLPYFEGSRQVGTLVLDEEGNKSYKITLVQGGSVLEQRDEDAIAFKDDNKHNVVVHKIVGVCPTKVD